VKLFQKFLFLFLVGFCVLPCGAMERNWTAAASLCYRLALISEKLEYFKHEFKKVKPLQKKVKNLEKQLKKKSLQIRDIQGNFDAYKKGEGFRLEKNQHKKSELIKKEEELKDWELRLNNLEREISEKKSKQQTEFFYNEDLKSQVRSLNSHVDSWQNVCANLAQNKLGKTKDKLFEVWKKEFKSKMEEEIQKEVFERLMVYKKMFDKKKNDLVGNYRRLMNRHKILDIKFCELQKENEVLKEKFG